MRDTAYINESRATLKAARRRVEYAHREYQIARRIEYDAFIAHLNALGAGPFTEIESRATERLINTVDRKRAIWLGGLRSANLP